MFEIKMTKREEELISQAARDGKCRIERERVARENYRKSTPVNDKIAKWTKIEGASVLRIKSSRYIGVPVTNRKNSAQFVILDLEDEYKNICTLRKKEVQGWLFRMYEK